MSFSTQTYANLCLNPKFPYEIIDAKNEVELSIGIEDEVLYINFLGSVSIKDWLHNFMFWKKPYKYMKNTFFVHAGFLKIYKIVQDKIHDYVYHNVLKFKKIIISGHSLGGAIATLCHEDLSYMKETKQLALTPEIELTTVTIGAPRVFSWIGSNILKSRFIGMTRLIYKNDGVTTVPPILFGFKHYGSKIHSGKRNLLGIFHPSFVYHHCVSRYGNFDNIRAKDTKETNYLYANSVKVYSIIYFVLAILIIILWLF